MTRFPKTSPLWFTASSSNFTPQHQMRYDLHVIYSTLFPTLSSHFTQSVYHNGSLSSLLYIKIPGASLTPTSIAVHLDPSSRGEERLMPVGWLCAPVYFSLQRSPAHQWRVQQTLSIRFLAYCQLQGHQRRVDLSPDALAEVFLRWTGPFSKEQSLVQCNSFTALDTIFSNVRIPEIFTPTVRHCSHKTMASKTRSKLQWRGLSYLLL